MPVPRPPEVLGRLITVEASGPSLFTGSLRNFYLSPSPAHSLLLLLTLMGFNLGKEPEVHAGKDIGGGAVE